jgi:SulP family sulfate permease
VSAARAAPLGAGFRVRRFRPDLVGTSASGIGSDAIAGLSVAAVSVPQGMAYALVAGLPLEMGLLAAGLPALVAALFGSSPYLVTGPTNPTALVVGASVVAPAIAAGGGVPIPQVLAIGMVSGLLLIGFALVGLGSASRFLADSVVQGLSVAVGLLVVVGQLAAATDLPRSAGGRGVLVPQVWPALVDAVRALFSLDPRTWALLMGVPLFVAGLRAWDARWPGGILALGGSAALSAALGWGEGPDALPVLAAATSVWPGLDFPGVADPALGAPALAIALLVTAQSLGASRSMSGPRVDFDRELFGQGAANLTASLIGAMPTSGSFARSSLARRSGARSRAAAAFSGVVVLFLLPVLGDLVTRIPLAALAGLVLLAGIDLVNVPGIRRACTTRGDRSILVVTVGAALWLGIVEAIYAGVFLSLALLVRRSGRLHMVEIVRAGRQRVREVVIDERTGRTPAVVLHLEGDLNFAVAGELADQLRAIGGRGTRVLILRLKRARHLDATVLEGLRHVFEEFAEQGVTPMLCGLNHATAESLARTEVGRLLGAEGLLETGPRLFEGLERAYARARALLAPLDDSEIFRDEQPDAWSYEI